MLLMLFPLFPPGVFRPTDNKKAGKKHGKKQVGTKQKQLSGYLVERTQVPKQAQPSTPVASRVARTRKPSYISPVLSKSIVQFDEICELCSRGGRERTPTWQPRRCRSRAAAPRSLPHVRARPRPRRRRPDLQPLLFHHDPCRSAVRPPRMASAAPCASISSSTR